MLQLLYSSRIGRSRYDNLEADGRFVLKILVSPVLKFLEVIHYLLQMIDLLKVQRELPTPISSKRPQK